MNERIKQLALDAGIGFTLWDDSGREMILNFTPEERLKKFAELIVQECAKLALTFNYNLQSLNDKEIRSHANRVSDYVKDHMGCNNEQSV